MENLFITQSKFNVSRLSDNKLMLLKVMEQIKEAYALNHYKETIGQDNYKVEFSMSKFGYRCSSFEIDYKGVISFRGAMTNVGDKQGIRLKKKYPKSITQISITQGVYYYILLDIDNITEHNLTEVLMDIVIVLEADGYILKR